MKTYTIYFELYSKKMKTDIIAESAKEAKKLIIDKIIWHKIEPKNDNDVFNIFKDIFK